MDMAERVDLLFRTVTKPDGKEYSYREVEELAGGAVTSTAIWKARTGRIQNPSKRLMEALSTAFEVPVNFFFEQEVTEEDIRRYQEQYHDKRLLDTIALRASDLDTVERQAVLDMIDIVQSMREESISINTSQQTQGGNNEAVPRQDPDEEVAR